MHSEEGVFKIISRAKELADGERRSASRIVELTYTKLEAHFALPIISAAERLGISMTTLKW